MSKHGGKPNSEPSYQISVHLDPYLMQDLKELAKENRTTLSGMIRLLIVEATEKGL